MGEIYRGPFVASGSLGGFVVFLQDHNSEVCFICNKIIFIDS